MIRPKKLAILCAGGPAPGLNSVIAAATIRAQLHGVEVVGIHDGFKWIMEGDTSKVSRLSIRDVSRIHFRGGSHLGISRANPTKNQKLLDATLLSLLKLDVDKLITIGGDGTAWSAPTRSRPHRKSTAGMPSSARHAGVRTSRSM